MMRLRVTEMVGEIDLPIKTLTEKTSMNMFETKHLPKDRDVVAPDGSDVRILLGLKGGGMAHFELGSGRTSRAVTHRTVEEIWFFISGRGEMWREQEGESQIVDVYPGVCLTIPLGTRFQFRCVGEEPLAAIGVTIPPWPGEGEAVLVDGPWKATAGDG
jgi:mannose-6-phosphate isomerase-like protein (cupin superfamily)